MNFWLELAADSLVNALGEVVNVAAVQSSHRNTAVMCHIDMSFLRKSLGLRGVKAGEAARNFSAGIIKGRRCKNHYLNIPIWLLMCPHWPGVFSSFCREL